MHTRRDFLKLAAILSGAVASEFIPESIKRAYAIKPEPGSTYLDAEHIVILMQENRSFDHALGTLRGVRGFNDPHVIRLPNGNSAFVQTDDSGASYAPWRLNIKDSRITWMGSLPHSRSSQVDAFNGGKHDQWLNAKKSGNKQYANIPLTMGYYTRNDLPFYYALADAFTVCDQHFSSAMTSTWPNRLYMWGGTIRSDNSGKVSNFIRNEIPYEEARLRTFPELLEDSGVSWEVYQNEICTGGGFNNDERAWLANFICNLLEFLPQYNVKFSRRYVQGLTNLSEVLPSEIADLKAKAKTASSYLALQKLQMAIVKKEEILAQTRNELIKWSAANYEKLSQREKNLFQKAFTTNIYDPDYHTLTTLRYKENGIERDVNIPKGDILYQFRKDVDSGQLPTVSWLVPPQNFSDHPSAPWYGAWITSEMLDILTNNPEVWKKTIFILTYDENDGYFDHVPPFVAPDPLDPATGKCSGGIDADVEYIRLENELEEGVPKQEARAGPIGLGFRVPLIVASPWSRGGYVCSQVLDHTSSLQFLEGFLSNKLGKALQETNISPWRRAVCGDLTSAFRAYQGDKPSPLPFIKKDPYIEQVYSAKFKTVPADFCPLSIEDIEQINNDSSSASAMPQQEEGIRPACAIPYELYAEGKLSGDRKDVEVLLKVGSDFFGRQSAGAPFNIYFPGQFASRSGVLETTGVRSYAVMAGDSLTEAWPLEAFAKGFYRIRVYGPNGFFRECTGDISDPNIAVSCEYEQTKGLIKKSTGNIALRISTRDSADSHIIEVRDNVYGNKPIAKTLRTARRGKEQAVVLVLNLSDSFGWYDFSVKIAGIYSFERRYAGHVEIGKDSYSDPGMGKVSTRGGWTRAPSEA